MTIGECNSITKYNIGGVVGTFSCLSSLVDIFVRATFDVPNTEYVSLGAAVGFNINRVHGPVLE